MLHRYLKPLSALILIISLSQCAKIGNDYTPVNPVVPPLVSQRPIDAGLDAHYSFKVGSYWVYKDSLSSRVDSFYVSKFDSLIAGGPDEGYTTTYISMQIKEKNLNHTNPADSATWVMTLTGADVSLTYYRDTNDTHTLEATYHLLTYPLGTPIYPVLGDTATLDTVYSNYVFNSYFFSNIHDYRHTNNMDSTVQNNATYIKDGFWITDDGGIIKLNLDHPYHAGKADMGADTAQDSDLIILLRKFPLAFQL